MNGYLNEYYETHDEDGRLLTQCGKVEFITTMHYIKKYLKPGMRILEIGAGTGRYSHALAREGFAVDAVELLAHNIDQFRKNTQPGESIHIFQGNAVQLDFLKPDAYDITLLLGPMYHLYTEEEKRSALSEAVRVTKKGGVVFASYCMSDPSIIGHGFKKGNIHSLIREGLLNPETFAAYSTPKEIFELHRKEDIERLRAQLPTTPLHFVSADGFTNHMRDTVDAMDESTFEIYLRYHFAICERADMTGWSHHTLDIFRKDEKA